MNENPSPITKTVTAFVLNAGVLFAFCSMVYTRSCFIDSFNKSTQETISEINKAAESEDIPGMLNPLQKYCEEKGVDIINDAIPPWAKFLILLGQ